MKKHTDTITDEMRVRMATLKRIDFVNMQDDELVEWDKWFLEHNEQDYHHERERSYFRVNKANCFGEIHWRSGDIFP